MTLFWCLYCYLWNYSPPCSSVSIAVFEQVFVCSVWTFLYFNRFKIWWFQVLSIFREDSHEVEYFHEVECTRGWSKSMEWKWTSIKFLWWNLNYELTALITNELHNFFNLNSVLFNFFMNWASNVPYVLLNTHKHHHVETLLYLGY